MKSIQSIKSIPNWQTKTLGEVCEIVNGGTPKTNVSKYWDGDILWITPKDMGKLKSPFVDETERRITAAGLADSSAKILPPNSIILSSRAPIGHLAINLKEITTNQGCKGLIPSAKLDVKYLYNFLMLSKEHLNDLGSGTTFKELSGSKLKEVALPLPSISEQRRIVAILDRVFEEAAKAKAALEKNLANARELFESYLQSVFANPGWEEKTVKEIGGTQTGNTPPTSNKKYYGDYIPFIKPADIDIEGDGTIRFDNEGLSASGLKAGRLIAKDSVLMVCIGASITKVGFSEIPVSCNQQINTLTPGDAFEPKFFYYAMRTDVFRQAVLLNASQATLPIINKGKWENLSIRFPHSRKEQSKIVEGLDNLSAETKHLASHYRTKLTSLEEMKKSVLRQAFSGQL